MGSVYEECTCCGDSVAVTLDAVYCHGCYRVADEQADCANAQLIESERRVAQLVAERERLLWVVCSAVFWHAWHLGAAERILAEYGYDQDRIERTARMPEPAVPK